MEIDLSQLPSPLVVQPLDFEAVLSELKALVLADLPELADVIHLESEPVHKVLQVIAYERVHMQSRINDSAKACMLAYAEASDLDHLAALLDVQRLEGENDTRLRRRAQMALEGASVAGPGGSYVFHALGADPCVLDAAVHSPVPGTVCITVLSTQNDGTASPELLAVVQRALSADDVRPLSDTVTVQSAEVIDYEVRATLHVYPGPAAEPLLTAASTALNTYLAEQFRLGGEIARSGLDACLHQPGVRRVELHSQDAVTATAAQAPRCTAVHLALGVAGD